MSTKYYEILDISRAPYLREIAQDERMEHYDVYYLTDNERLIAEYILEAVSAEVQEWKYVAPLFDDWRIPEEEVDEYNKDLEEEQQNITDRVADYYRRSL